VLVGTVRARRADTELEPQLAFLPEPQRTRAARLGIEAPVAVVLRMMLEEIACTLGSERILV
jgi:hypothetical protein